MRPTLAFTGLLLFWSASSHASGTFVARPGDDLQAIVDGACDQGGGSILLEAGTYRLEKSLLLWCDGLALSGAGADATELVWDRPDEPFDTSIYPGRCPRGAPLPSGVYPGLVVLVPLNDAPDAADPLFSWLCQPPDPFRLLQGVSIERLAIARRSPAPPSTARNPTNAIGVLWADHPAISKVRMDGFTTGVWSARSDGVTIEYSDIVSLGAPCILFAGQPDDPPGLKPFTTGGSIHQNTLSQCPAGVVLTNAQGVDVQKNFIRATGFGIQSSGGKDHRFTQNTIVDIPACPTGFCGAFGLRHTANSTMGYNNVCRSPNAVVYLSPSPAVFAPLFPAISDGNLYHYNTHFAVPRLTFIAPNVAPFVRNHQALKNDDAEICPE